MACHILMKPVFHNRFAWYDYYRRICSSIGTDRLDDSQGESIFRYTNVHIVDVDRNHYFLTSWHSNSTPLFVYIVDIVLWSFLVKDAGMFKCWPVLLFKPLLQIPLCMHIDAVPRNWLRFDRMKAGRRFEPLGEPAFTWRVLS